MTTKPYKKWHVVRTVELAAPAAEVWKLVGGFYNLHHWHPDIALTEVVPDQTDIPEVRRLLTFPGQPKTTEQLVMMDNENFHYRYKWHSGAWGERVKDYVADLHVVALDGGETCLVQWQSTFSYPEDAITQFYRNGFKALVERFGAAPAKGKSSAPLTSAKSR